MCLFDEGLAFSVIGVANRPKCKLVCTLALVIASKSCKLNSPPSSRGDLCSMARLCGAPRNSKWPNITLWALGY